MYRKIREWFSIQLVKNPGGMVISAILLFNIVFFLLSALVISNLSLTGTEKMGFLEAAFCTITMILDAGCIQFVIADIGQSGVWIAIICLAIILIGMITFTGAVIGYITNFISGFIENANAGTKKIKVSGHVVILNWNTRASEIINDLLYCSVKQKVVVLVPSRKKEIEKEIEERLSDTVSKENEEIIASSKDMGLIEKFFYRGTNRIKNNLTVIVREGDVFSSKQLRDLSLEHAKMVVILGNDINNTICKFEHRELIDEHNRGNPQTIKTLMQVADITSAQYSDDNQKIIVEITDDWTAEIVDKIIQYKQVDQKCNIVPLRVNRILGQILSQFSLMPELNLIYRELFSNKGAAFYSAESDEKDENAFISKCLVNQKHVLPLTVMKNKGKNYCFYSAGSQKDIQKTSVVSNSDYSVEINKDYWIEQKNIIILGHNSKCQDIMRGFGAFRSEWGYKDSNEEIVNIIVIDDEKSLEKYDWYKEYPFVVDTIAADIYNDDLICSSIERFVALHKANVSILILSDDSALNEDIDANVLTNLVYVQDIINNKIKKDKDFDVDSIDIVVEIIDPKHHDIVNSYSVNNVVLSNRFISKMITQIGEKEALYDFYADILTYDEETSSGFESKEIYTKDVVDFFDKIPPKCKADELVRALYRATTDLSLPEEKHNPAIALGYVKPGGKMVLFSGDQSNIPVELEEHDKIIVFSNH